jgi:polyisoprenoid-binding protein YceI
MEFRSHAVIPKTANEYELRGALTIKNVTRPINLSIVYNGSDEDQYGKVKYGFEITGKINRKDWGLDFNVPGGRSTLLIGDEVILEANIQMMKV